MGIRMLNQRVAAIHIVQPELTAMEQHLIASIEAGGRLTLAIGEARRAASLSPLVGRAPINHAAKASALLAEALDHLLEAHHGFALTASDELRVPERLWGPGQCPPITGSQSWEAPVAANG